MPRSLPPAGPPRFDIQGAGQIILTSERIDKMIAARDLATRGERAMLAARLRVPDGTAYIEERSGLDAGAKSKLMARLSPWLLVRPAELNADALRLLALVHQSPTVKDAAERFKPPVELAKILSTVQYFLLYGLLEVA